MVVIDRWSLYRSTVSNDSLIKYLLCTGFLMWKLPWAKPNFYKVRRSCKQLNEVSKSGKILHKVSKISEQFYEDLRICQQHYEVRRICQHFYEVFATHKKVL